MPRSATSSLAISTSKPVGMSSAAPLKPEAGLVVLARRRDLAGLGELGHPGAVVELAGASLLGLDVAAAVVVVACVAARRECQAEPASTAAAADPAPSLDVAVRLLHSVAVLLVVSVLEDLAEEVLGAIRSAGW